MRDYRIDPLPRDVVSNGERGFVVRPWPTDERDYGIAVVWMPYMDSAGNRKFNGPLYHWGPRVFLSDGSTKEFKRALEVAMEKASTFDPKEIHVPTD